jgi:hypothetical protein
VILESNSLHARKLQTPRSETSRLKSIRCESHRRDGDLLPPR